MISDDDNFVLSRIGIIFKQNLKFLVVDTLFYGLFVAMFCYSTFLLIRRRNRIALALSILAFTLGTTRWATSVSYNLLQIGGFLQEHLDLDLQDRGILFVNDTFSHDTVSNWTGNLTPILSDITVLWRAYIIFPEARRLLILPCLCFVSLIITTLYYNAVRLDRDTWFTIQLGEDPTHLFQVQSAMFFLSFGTNFLTTVFMGYRLWSHRQFLKEMLGKGRANQGSERALGILLETGLVYCALQFALAILVSMPSASTETERFMGTLFLTIYGQLSAMYPVIVIILVQLRMSIADTLRSQTVPTLPTISTFRTAHFDSSCSRSDTLRYSSDDSREQVTLHSLKPNRFPSE